MRTLALVLLVPLAASTVAMIVVVRIASSAARQAPLFRWPAITKRWISLVPS